MADGRGGDHQQPGVVIEPGLVIDLPLGTGEGGVLG
jgi:hypothetical protein